MASWGIFRDIMAEEHTEYALPEGDYLLHEETAPHADGYVTARDMAFTVKEDGSITKVEMEDDFSKADVSKTDITGETELVGVTLQILNSGEEVPAEWVSDGTEHRIEYLPVGGALTLREIQTIDGYRQKYGPGKRWLSLDIFFSFQRINFRGRRNLYESCLPLFGTIYFPTDSPISSVSGKIRILLRP